MIKLLAQSGPFGTMASPVEGVALAIINDIVFSALASSELGGVGRWRHVR